MNQAQTGTQTIWQARELGLSPHAATRLLLARTAARQAMPRIARQAGQSDIHEFWAGSAQAAPRLARMSTPAQAGNGLKVDVRRIARLDVLRTADNLRVTPDAAWHQDQVHEREHAYKRLPAWARRAAAIAYVFGSKVPRQERADVAQMLFGKLWAEGDQPEAWQYRQAKCDWADWYESYVRKQSPVTLTESVEKELVHMTSTNELALTELESTNTEAADTIGAARAELRQRAEDKRRRMELFADLEFEARMTSNIDARRAWLALPDRIRDIAIARQNAQPISAADRKALERWLKTDEAQAVKGLLVT